MTVDELRRSEESLLSLVADIRAVRDGVAPNDQRARLDAMEAEATTLLLRASADRQQAERWRRRSAARWAV